MTSPITTHILDLQRGKPAMGIAVQLFAVTTESCALLAQGVANQDGRVSDLLFPGKIEPGTYRLSFATRAYFESVGQEEIFYPLVTVDFSVTESQTHYHVPLLLAAYGYSTYRGS